MGKKKKMESLNGITIWNLVILKKFLRKLRNNFYIRHNRNILLSIASNIDKQLDHQCITFNEAQTKARKYNKLLNQVYNGNYTINNQITDSPDNLYMLLLLLENKKSIFMTPELKFFNEIFVPLNLLNNSFKLSDNKEEEKKKSKII